MKRTVCSGCGYDDLQLFLDLGFSPIADAYTSSANEVSNVYPLQLAVCTGCWLVQLLEVVDHDVLFGTGYSFYSSASPPLSQYHQAYATDVLNTHGKLAESLTLEIGCNDGDMLRWFAKNNCKTIGVDPAGGPVVAARERGLHVWNVAFNEHVACSMLNDIGPAGVVIANHVLAHVEDVSSVLAGIAKMMGPDGIAMIEVQYLPDLLLNNAFDLVYHEHRNFFSLSSLEKVAQRHGLYPVDVELTDRQGGSIRVTFARNRRHSSSVDAVRASEDWLRKPSAYDGLQGRVERIRARLRDIVMKELHDGATIAGYGAPAKATTLLNFCGIDNSMLEFVIDTTKAKQGRYIPGTGLRIVPPQDVSLTDIDACVLLSWNYAQQIIRNNESFLQTGGKWIIPIPAPVII